MCTVSLRGSGSCAGTAAAGRCCQAIEKVDLVVEFLLALRGECVDEGVDRLAVVRVAVIHRLHGDRLYEGAIGDAAPGAPVARCPHRRARDS